MSQRRPGILMSTPDKQPILNLEILAPGHSAHYFLIEKRFFLKSARAERFDRTTYGIKQQLNNENKSKESEQAVYKYCCFHFSNPS